MKKYYFSLLMLIIIIASCEKDRDTNQPPTAAVSISGKTQVGQTLTANTSASKDPEKDKMTFTYQWYRANDDKGDKETAIGGANKANYLLTNNEQGKYITVKVIANDGKINSKQISANYVGKVIAAPKPNQPPIAAIKIIGKTQVGQTLIADTSASNDPDGDKLTFTYQWYKADDNKGSNETAIGGANKNNCPLKISDEGKYLTVKVIANDGKINSKKVSANYVGKVIAAPKTNQPPIAAVKITGKTQVGQTLIADTSASNDPNGDKLTFTYQWYKANDNKGSNETAISGANKANYLLTNNEQGKYITVKVIANDGKINSKQISANYVGKVIAAPKPNQPPTAAVSISGKPEVGQTLIADTSASNDPDRDTLTFTYQWYKADDNKGSNETAISGANKANYLLTNNEQGKYITVKVIANDGKINSKQISANYVGKVIAAPKPNQPPTAAVSISGKPEVGQTLIANTSASNDPDRDTLTFTYQWYKADDNKGSNETAISGANKANYLLTNNEQGKYITVKVIANDGKINSKKVSANYVGKVATAPVANLPNNPYELVDGKMPVFDDLFSNLKNNPGLDKYITEDFYNRIFSERGEYFVPPTVPHNGSSFNFTDETTQNNIELGKQVTAYKHFKTAVNFLYTRGGKYAKLFNEGTEEDIKRELAAIAAHIWQETKGFKYNVEQRYHPLYDTHGYYGYHGRGPKQLSYDYNYRPVSQFIFGNRTTLMLNGKFNYKGKEYTIGPGAVAVDGRIAWVASLWFFLEPQGSKPSMHDVIIAPKGTFFAGKPAGFGLTTSIINGGIECKGGSESRQSKSRIDYYNQFLTLLGISDDREKACRPSVGVGRF